MSDNGTSAALPPGMTFWIAVGALMSLRMGMRPLFAIESWPAVDMTLLMNNAPRSGCGDREVRARYTGKGAIRL
jgi:hypothetical protein